MGTKVTPLCLCILTALLASTVVLQNAQENCTTDMFHQARVAAESCDRYLLSKWSAEDRAQLLHSMAMLTTMLKQSSHPVDGCHLSNGSPSVKVHSNGGVVCVDIEEKVYCKPMCNHGYDFSFLRRGRPYEVCSAGNWTTQFIGGNILAVCHLSTTQISAKPSSYFKGQDCLKTKDLGQDEVIQEFITELRAQQITGAVTNGTLMCN
ncbi:unnamed protein product [Boreogadus saida]